MLIPPAGYFWQGFFALSLTLAINFIAALTGQRRRFPEGCGGFLTRYRAGRGWLCPSAFKICAVCFPFTVNDWLSKQNNLSWQKEEFANKPKIAQLALEITWAQYYY